MSTNKTGIPSLNQKLSSIAEGLQDRVHSRKEIVQAYHSGLKECFESSGITIFLLDSSTNSVALTYPSNAKWKLPTIEKEWIIKRTKDLLIKGNSSPSRYYYIEDRKNFFYADKLQLKKDMSQYNYSCSDSLYIILISEDESILGIIQVNNWENKKKLTELNNFKNRLKEVLLFSSEIVVALDNLFIHQKIETLLSDKKELKQRIQKDEEDLKRRILELTVLYDSSNDLGHSLDHHQIVNLLMDSLYKVLHFDVCAIFLLDFVPEGEIITRVNKPLKTNFIKTVQGNIIQAVIPFTQKTLDPSKVKLTIQKKYKNKNSELEDQSMKSFANVPLIFKEEVIGILNVCSTSTNVFARSEMTFLHTMANQLASHLGRIKIVRQLEKSKMNSLIQSMSEGVMMIDMNNELEIMNPVAQKFFNLDANPSNESVFQSLEKAGLKSIYDNFQKSGKLIRNKDITFDNRILNTSMTCVQDAQNNQVGTVFVFRDVTELQQINRINSQRLNIISKLHVIINSITDLEKLLDVLMEFILNVIKADMGAIQLREGKTFHTMVHSNFPDKIRRQYKFNSGETISEYVARTKDICFLENYHKNSKVNQDTKVLIDSYVCIPIVIKNNLIGIINIAIRYGQSQQRITTEDIETLKTITGLIGTSINNARLYQETLKKQNLEREIQVAYDIQSKLLPSAPPTVDKFQFGTMFVPAREIGGDYYDFFELGNGKLGVIIADIVGKGIPAGLFMAMLKSIAHSHIPHLSSPIDVMKKLNAIIFADPVINKFVPLIYGILNTQTNTFTYSNAGHEPGVVFSKGKFTLLEPDGMPLGLDENPTYKKKTIKLKNEDILLLFTDGVIEAKAESGKTFGMEEIERIITQEKDHNAQEIVEALFNECKSFSGKTQQHDDITIVAIKHDKNKKPNDLEKPIKIKEFQVTSARKNVKVIREEVGKIAQEMGFNTKDIFDLKLVINEAHANVIEHAYLGDENGKIIFKFQLFEDRLEISIKDFGAGINQKTTKGEEHLDELEGSGLGVYLIRSFMDKVKYNRTARVGTELLLTKYIASTEKSKKANK